MNDDITRVNPFAGALATFGALADQAKGNEWWRRGALTDEIGNITVDTVFDCFDTGKPETGININGKWIIVEQYLSEYEARAGHAKWVKTMTENPGLEPEDIHVWGE